MESSTRHGLILCILLLIRVIYQNGKTVPSENRSPYVFKLFCHGGALLLSFRAPQPVFFFSSPNPKWGGRGSHQVVLWGGGVECIILPIVLHILSMSIFCGFSRSIVLSPQLTDGGSGRQSQVGRCPPKSLLSLVPKPWIWEGHMSRDMYTKLLPEQEHPSSNIGETGLGCACCLLLLVVVVVVVVVVGFGDKQDITGEGCSTVYVLESTPLFLTLIGSLTP